MADIQPSQMASLIERSSLGAPESRRLRSLTDPAVVERVLDGSRDRCASSEPEAILDPSSTPRPTRPAEPRASSTAAPPRPTTASPRPTSPTAPRTEPGRAAPSIAAALWTIGNDDLTDGLTFRPLFMCFAGRATLQAADEDQLECNVDAVLDRIDRNIALLAARDRPVGQVVRARAALSPGPVLVEGQRDLSVLREVSCDALDLSVFAKALIGDLVAQRRRFVSVWSSEVDDLRADGAGIGDDGRAWVLQVKNLGNQSAGHERVLIEEMELWVIGVPHIRDVAVPALRPTNSWRRDVQLVEYRCPVDNCSEPSVWVHESASGLIFCANRSHQGQPMVPSGGRHDLGELGLL